MSFSLKELPDSIGNIILFYIKKQYNNYLFEHKIEEIPEENITNIITNMYNEKEKELKKFIRNTMRKNFNDYDLNLALKTGTEEIILEIFDDKDFSVSKVSLEISNFQKNKQNKTSPIQTI